jgi:hypothetical protein
MTNVSVKTIRPSRQAIDKIERENPNASPAAKYRLAQVETMVKEVAKRRSEPEGGEHP